MKGKRLFRAIMVSGVVVLGLLGGKMAQGGEVATRPGVPPVRERFHLYLLIGQSNMAGRGAVEADDKVAHPRVLMLTREDQWVPAVDPLHFDKPGAGVGPGRTFALAMAESDPEVTIGLIPCACGGSPISTWEPGEAWAQTKSHPYDEMLRRARSAMAAGVLKGILWHQGESDSVAGKAEVYAAKLDALVGRIRKDLQVPDVPFLAGGLGRFEGSPWPPAKATVNHALETLPQRVQRTAYVTSEGLTDRGDHVLFDTKSQREFGRRYAKAYLALVSGNVLPAPAAGAGSPR